ncbi:immunoglobulin-like domain-containing protein [Ruminiclostridium cellulolyticum]|uniref:S-layer domain protein n=1 Tax=Ruminiclostridium cellulolyticum (strain ATCC 35319 / DSM 5812 / JCM 6584 / H10) TaxID=394503 RepID=B8I273_RUMCH|nr:immunoglobulin-like domain-containing protein [Ruminiclostridium cellulolyticum]ACL75899.1 S-layer domain protein [Ruminiclostridium cellulolyticum H10]
MRRYYKFFCFFLAVVYFLTCFNLSIGINGVQNNIAYAESNLTEAVWIPRDSGTTQNVNAVVYGAGLFVAVGNSGTIITSIDGSEWNIQPSGTASNLKGIIYSGSLYVAIGDAGTIMTSQDGYSWEKRASGTSKNLNAIAYGGGTYVIGASSEMTNKANILRSNDGIDWTKMSVESYGGASWLSMSRAEYLDGNFYVGGNYGNFYFSSDSTATSWNYKRDSSVGGSLGNAVYGNGFYVTSISDSSTKYFESVDNGAGVTLKDTSGGRVVRFLENNFYFGCLDGKIKMGATTADAIEWQETNTPETTSDINEITYAGDRFYAIGTEGLIMESFDGQNWFAVNSFTTNNLTKIARSENMLIAVGSKGTISTKRLDGTIKDTDITVLDKYRLTEVDILGANLSAGNVTEDLNLMTAGENGSTISWSSDRLDIISSEGKVTRPPYSGANAEVVLTATITCGTSTEIKSFTVTVIEQDEVVDYDAASVEADIAVLELTFAEGDSSASVTQPLGQLPAFGANGTTITWTSNNTGILSNDGQILNRSSCGDSDVLLTLTATVKKGGISGAKAFPLLIKKLEQTDEQAVAEDADAIDISAILNGNTDSQSITGDLILPTAGERGSAITWSSNNPTVISNEGKVTRPTYNTGNTNVTLTATITKGGISAERVYVFTVIRNEQTDEQAVAEDADAIDISTILNGNTDLQSITGNLILPTAGERGSAITWSSNNPAIISNDGRVTRPAFSTGNITVTLTSTIAKGKVSIERKFSFTIVKNDQTDEEAVEAYSRMINDRHLLSGNESLLKVVENLTLPTKGAFDTTIFWSSSDSSVISNTGVVTRPAYELQDTCVTLTATISKGTASKTKAFKITVIKMPDTTAPVVVTTNPQDNKYVSTFTNVELTFDEDITLSAKADDIKLRYKASKWSWFKKITVDVYETVSVSIDQKNPKKLIIDPDKKQLKGNTEYTFVLPVDAVCDMSRNSNSEVKLSFTTGTEDKKAPDFSSINPKDGETKVKADRIIEISFDENIYPSKKFSSIRLEASGQKVPCSIITSGSKVIMTPENPLVENQKYTVVLPYDSVEDKGGNKYSSIKSLFEDEVKFKFTTAVEFSEPKVQSIFPVDGAKKISTMSQLMIEFNENITKGTAFDQVAIKGPASENVGAIISISGRYLIINPKNSLKKNTAYSIVIPEGSLKDNNENTISDSFEYRFSTDSGLQLIEAEPGSKENEAPIDKSLLFTFNSNIHKGNNFMSISLKDLGGNTVDIKADLQQNDLFITPVSPLTKGTKYYLKVPEGALKDAGGTENGALLYSFGVASELDINWESIRLESTRYPIENHEVIFDASSLTSKFEVAGRKVLDYKWSFGDGKTAVGERVSHIYSEPDQTYNATLTIVDDKGIAYTRTIWLNTKQDYGLYELEVSPGNVILPDAINDAEAVEFEYRTRTTKQGNNISNSTVIAQLLDTNGKVLKVISELTDSDGYATFRIKKPKGYTSKVLNVKIIQSVNNKEVYRQIIYEGFKDNIAIEFLIYDMDKQTLLDPSKRDKLDVYVNGELKVANKVYDNPGKAHPISKVLSKDQPYKFRLEGLRTGCQQIEIKNIPYYCNFEQKVIVRNTGSKVAMEKFDVKRFIPSGKPVVSRVYSDVSDSRDNESSKVFKGVPVEYKVSVNWADHEPGYFQFIYEDKNGKQKAINTKGYTYLNKIEIPNDCKEGSRLQVIAWSVDGTKSNPLDLKVKIVSLPEFATAKVVNGKFEVKLTQSLPGVQTPKAVKSFPLIGGSTIGFSTDHFGVEGEMDEEGTLTLAIKGKGEKTKEWNKEELLKNGKKKELEIAGVGIEGAMGAQFKYKYDNEKGEWVFAGGGVVIEIEGSASYTQHFTIAVIPCYLRGKIVLGLGTELMAEKNFDEGDYDFKGSIEVSPSVEIALGAGGGSLKVEGYLGGVLDIGFEFPSTEYAVNAKVTGGIRATAFLFEYEKKCLSYEWNIKSGKVRSMMLAPRLYEFPETGQFKLMGRQYLTEQTNWNGFTDPLRSMRMFSLYGVVPEQGTSNITDRTLQSNVFPNTDQILLNSGDKTIMVWVSDNPKRSALNRTEIVYSVLADGVWSEPQPMNIDNTADFKPVMSKLDNGTLMAWENVGKVLEDDILSGENSGTGSDEISDISQLNGLTEMVSSMEIGVASVSSDLSGWENSRNLTNDIYLDHSPRIASSGNTAILTWIKNESNDLTGSAEKPNKIMFSKWDGTLWSEPESICEGVGAIVDSSVAYDGDRGLYTYTVDSDGNFATEVDQEVYVLFFDAGGWSTPLKVTENNVQDANPSAFFLNGKAFLMWYQDGSIVYTKDIEQGSSIKVPTVSNADGKFKTTVSITSEAAIVYTETTNGGQNIYTTLYDSTNDVWSEKIQLTDTQNNLASSLSPVFDSEGNLIVAYSKVGLYKSVVDGIEYNSIGNTDLSVVTLYPKHDLSIEKGGIATLEENPVSEMNATITAEIRNEGEYTERNVEVDFYNGNPSNGGQKIGNTYVITQPIAPRTSVMAQMEWAIPEPDGIQDVYVVIDPNEKLYDADRGNNIAYNSLVRADLLISKMDYIQSIIDSDESTDSERTGYMNFLVSADVSNTGSIPVNNATLTLYENGTDGQIIEKSEIDRLEPGETKTVYVMWDANGKPFENNRFTVAGELGAEGVQEYSLDNNIYYKSIKTRSLTVDRYTPGINEMDVPLDSNVTLEFNMDIFKGGFYDNITFVDSEGNEIAFTKTIEDNRLILDPEELLKHGGTYAVSIPVNAVNGYDGSVMNEAFLIKFTAERLYPYPVVKFIYPQDKMGGIPVNSDINIKFSGSIKAGGEYAGITLTDSQGQEVDIKKSINNDMLKIDPIAYLDDNSTYFVAVPFGAISYMNGITTEDEYTFSFITSNQISSRPETEPGSKPDSKPQPQPQPEPTPNPGSTKDKAGVGDSHKETVSISISAKIEISDSTGIIKASVDKNMIETALSKVVDELEGAAKAKAEIVINLDGEGAKEVLLQIPKDAFDKIAEVAGVALKLNKGMATVKFDEQAINYISSIENAGDINFSIKKVEPETLTREAQDKIGDRPFIDLQILAGESEITSFGGGKVSVDIPYTPKADEKHYAILVYYIDGEGRLISTMGQYNPESKTVGFTTLHFSKYAVGYNDVRFDDVGEESWYSEAIGFLAAREVINGIGNGSFAPGKNISRGDFLIMVMNAHGIAADSTISDNFADAGNKYYTPYLGTAKRLGLVSGIGSNMYDPESAISRQDMAVILHRILERIGKLPTEKKGYTLESFEDAGNISGYAINSMKLFVETGILNGDGKKLHPVDISTRAEAVQIIYNLQQ